MFFRLHKTQIPTTHYWTAKADPTIQTCAQPYAIWFAFLQHGQFGFNRKCMHRYAIWFPLINHVQFHNSYMRRCSSIGHVCTVDVNILRKKACAHSNDIWFPLLQRWQFHLSCMSRTSIGHESTVHVYIYGDEKGARAQQYVIWLPLLQHGQFHLSCMLICHEPV